MELALEAVRKKRDARYYRYVRALDENRDRLAIEVDTRRRTRTCGQLSNVR